MARQTVRAKDRGGFSMLIAFDRSETNLQFADARISLITVVCLFALTVQSANAAEASQAAGRGMSWESIEKLPDWGRGMWTPGRPPAAAAPAPGQPAAPRPAGVGAFGGNIPFTPKYKAMSDARMLRVRGLGPGGREDIPLSNSGFCIPSGVPGNMGLVSHEYVFKPGLVIMILENSEIRRIWIDGRGHPPDDESNPDFQGHSVGRWEGDALVVDTRQIYPEAELFFGMTVTDQTVIKERIQLADKDTLQIDTVVEDAELFTKPWTYTRYFRREDRESVPYESCTLADRAKKIGDKLIGIDFDVNKVQPGDKK
jgi:hypothetical protein